MFMFISFLASGGFGHLLITFANSLDPDLAQQNVNPVMDPNPLTLILFIKKKKKFGDNKSNIADHLSINGLGPLFTFVAE